MTTKTLRLTLLLALALGGCRERPAAEVAGTPAPAPATAVTTAVVEAQALDQDGDGRVDTWLTDQPDGSQLEERDTDGDGAPDQTRRLEPLAALPPGFELPAELEPQ